MLFRLIQMTAVVLSLFSFNCSQLGFAPEENSENQILMQAIFGIAAKEGCSIQKLSPISNTLSYVAPQRVGYDLYNCSLSDLGSLGLIANVSAFEKGLNGHSPNAILYSSANVVLPISNGGTNLEISFSLEPGGSLTTYVYGSGTPISGPAIRLSDSTQEEFYSSMTNGFETISQGTAALPSNTNLTYCIDFQYTNSEQWINAWPKRCSQVSQSERNSMMMFPVMQMMDVPSYSGNRIGFVLNGAKLTSFIIGSILSQVD